MAKQRKVVLDIASEFDQVNEVRKAEFRILIVCEDEKWEPTYLSHYTKAIDSDKCYVLTVGTGKNTLSVVQDALLKRSSFNDSLVTQGKRIPKTIEETWVVFDKDDQTSRYSQAIEKAKESSPPINLAVSNEAFELWLLLHFEDVDFGIYLPRREIYNRLKSIIEGLTNNGVTYNHKEFDLDIINLIYAFGSESDAITRAKALEAHQNSDLNKNPITLMHHLVERLKEFALEYPKEN